MTERRIQRFRVIAAVGKGGMGAVYRAYDPQLEREVAIKVLQTSEDSARNELSTVNTVDLRDAGASKDSLLHEARIMAQLSHPNVVPIYEVGLDGNDVFVVMEYVDGADLRNWLATPRAPGEVRAALAQAAAGLAAAHARGIVHRDFKPDNVLIGSDGRARVADFGLSRLAPTVSMVRTNDLAGTPTYMAPELWRGEAASAKSDVYAFAKTVVEALAPVPPEVKTLVDAGLSESPEARPEMSVFGPALGRETVSPTASARQRLVVGVLGGGILAVGIAIAVVIARDDDGCPDVIGDRWDAKKRAAFVASVGDGTPVIAEMDARATEVSELQRATCKAEQLGSTQLEQRTSCLRRRAIELGVVADLQIETTTPAHAAEVRLHRTPSAATCETLELAGVRDDPALYHRLATVTANDKPEVAIPELEHIAAQAMAAGDRELAARAQIVLGIKLRNADKLTESDDVLQKAHLDAIAVRSHDSAASALAERAWTLAITGDTSTARSLCKLALDLAAQHGISRRTHMRVYFSLGQTGVLRGEYRQAAAELRKALELGKQQRNTDIELLSRMSLAESLLLSLDDRVGAVAYARDTVEFAKQIAGEVSANYAYALDTLGKAYLEAGRAREAIESRKQALGVFAKLYPEHHSRVVNARGELAVTMIADARFEEARRELAQLVELATKNPATAQNAPWFMANHAQVTFELGRHDEALDEYKRALERMTSEYGGDHAQTRAQRHFYAQLNLEAGKLDEAQRAADTLVESYRRKVERHDVRPAALRGTLVAAIARARGRATEAEKLARDALTELTELRADQVEVREVEHELAIALLDQGRHAEARPLLERVLAGYRATFRREDELALVELDLARADAAIGKRAEARARAERARDVLAKYPGQPRARAAAAKLLR